MSINVFGNSSTTSEIKTDTTLFVQRRYVRTTFEESNIEEDIELKNQYRIKNIPDSMSIKEAASKNNVDNKFNYFGILKNTARVDFNDKKLDNVRVNKINSMLAVGEHLTSKCYVDQAISNSESTLVRNNQDNDFNNHNLTNIYSITLNNQAVDDNQVSTKSYLEQFCQKH